LRFVVPWLLAEVTRVVQTPKTFGFFPFEPFAFAIAFALARFSFPFLLPFPLEPLVKRRELLPFDGDPFPFAGCNL
jgi:hypothetical protein